MTMLLDNHYGPDPRVEFEADLLARAGAQVRIVAWDRRVHADQNVSQQSIEAPDRQAEVVRINVAAPSGGGQRTFRAMGRFARIVFNRRQALAGDADVLIVHDVYLLPLGSLLAAWLGKPLVYDAHEEYGAMEALRYPPWALGAVTRFESMLARRASAIVVPGNSRVRRWTEAGFRTPTVLRNLAANRARPTSAAEPEWDLAYCGTIADVRRLDVLLEAARMRPDLRFAVAGRGRGAAAFARRAAELDNVNFHGWVGDPDAIVTRSRSLYYGLDPTHPYAAKACPNALYNALRLRRPLLYFCGGEVAEVAAQYRIGLRLQPTPESLIAALDRVRNETVAWEFDDAWADLVAAQTTEPYVDSVLGSVRNG